MNCGILYLPTDAGSLGNEAIISRESAGDVKSRIFPSLPFDIIHFCAVSTVYRPGMKERGDARNLGC
jgi:hypothetical protein